MNKNYIEFYLQREVDESGVSGTGIVARGVRLLSGQAIMEWQTQHQSMGLYPDLTTLLKVHGHGGKTRLFIGTAGFGGVREFKVGDQE